MKLTNKWMKFASNFWSKLQKTSDSLTSNELDIEVHDPRVVVMPQTIESAQSSIDKMILLSEIFRKAKVPFSIEEVSKSPVLQYMVAEHLKGFHFSKNNTDLLRPDLDFDIAS